MEISVSRISSQERLQKIPEDEESKQSQGERSQLTSLREKIRSWKLNADQKEADAQRLMDQ